MRRWRGWLHESWGKVAGWRRERANRKVAVREERELARRWASTQLVAEMRRHNDLLGELVGVLKRFLQPRDREAMGDVGADGPNVTVDEVGDADQLKQETADRVMLEVEEGRITLEEAERKLAEMGLELVDRVPDEGG